MVSDVKVYTAAEVAKRLGVKTSTICLWCKKGMVKGSFTTIGGQWRIPVETVKEWLKDD